MVRRSRSYDSFGTMDGRVSYNRCHKSGVPAAMPSALSRPVMASACHDRDSIPPFRSRAPKDILEETENRDKDAEVEAESEAEEFVEVKKLSKRVKQTSGGVRKAQPGPEAIKKVRGSGLSHST